MEAAQRPIRFRSELLGREPSASSRPSTPWGLEREAAAGVCGHGRVKDVSGLGLGVPLPEVEEDAPEGLSELGLGQAVDKGVDGGVDEGKQRDPVHVRVGLECPLPAVHGLP